jgi:hypothetical protein
MNIKHLGTKIIISQSVYDFASAVYMLVNSEIYCTYVDKFEIWNSPIAHSKDYNKYLKLNMSSDIRKDLRAGKIDGIYFVKCENHFDVGEYLRMVPKVYIKQLNKIDGNWISKIESGEIPSIVLPDAQDRLTEIFGELGT